MPIFDGAIRRVLESDDPERFFRTIEAKNNSDLWIQIKELYLNFAYPFSDEPNEMLRRLGIVVPPDVELVEWEASTFATFEHSFEDLPSTSEFVRQYMTVALDLADDENSTKVLEEFL